MKPPFTSDQFFSVFADYNASVFPIQIVILLLGLAALLMLRSKYSWKNLYLGTYLGLIWLWAGLIYHVGFFSDLNKPAYVFGALFIIQGLFILYELSVRKRLRFSLNKTAVDGIGLFLVVFGLIIYPFISWLSEGSLDHIISIGLPCPTTITTIGILMLNKENTKWYLFIIPILWSIVGLSAAINFGVYQDFVMLLSAITWIVAEKVKRNTMKEVKAEVTV